MQTYQHATPLADEASRYLEAIELCRVLGRHVRWRSETVEHSLGNRTSIERRAACDRCANPLVRINGRHLCFGS
jgi:hypothetical protein